MFTPRSANLEEMFQQVEAEANRRALEAEQVAVATSRTPSPSNAHALNPVSSVGTLNSVSIQSKTRRRKRGSISVSRFGQVEEEELDAAAIPRSASKLSDIASRSPLYMQPQWDSVDSFGSGTGRTSPIEDHVTQMHHISGKQSISRTVGGMLSRTLSRSGSKNNLKVNMDPQNIIIGVAVQEDHVIEALESHSEEHEEITDRSATTVHTFVQRQPSKKSLRHSDNWFQKAKSLAQKFRRRSQVDVKTPVPASP